MQQPFAACQLGSHKPMRIYLDLLKHVLDNGSPKSDRTGIGTISTFGYQLRFNLQEGFPILTTKKIHLRSIIYELLWFLNGDTNIKYLNDNRVTIWDEWADSQGSIGRAYGAQWRSWRTTDGQTIDQISRVIDQIKTDPDSRRLIVSAWNVGELDQMALPPCHTLFQFYVANNKLSCQLYNRSSDLFLGWDYNICSYSLLIHMIAQQCNLEPGELIWVAGDQHIYLNHLDQVKLQLTREPYPLPQLVLNRKPETIFDYKFEDFELINYQSHPSIYAPVAV